MMYMASRQKIQRKLEDVFPAKQATVLAEVIDDAYKDLVKTDDFNELKGIVADLAKAQGRTEEKVGRLADRMEELAQLQKQTEEKIGGLADRIDELTTAQKQTEWGLKELARQVGGLARSNAYALENEAYRLLPNYLERKFGVKITQRFVRTTIAGQEINFFAQGEREGKRVCLIGESKLRFDERRGKTNKIFDQLDRQVEIVQREHDDCEEIIRFFVTHFARPVAKEIAAERGILLIESFEY